MTEFYVCLPSNSSMLTYPDNSGGHYYTNLPQAIDLSGRDYEVGLSEITFSNSYSNVLKDEIILFIQRPRGDAYVELRLKPGLYNSAQYFIDHLNGLLLKVFDRKVKKIKFYYHTASRRCTMRIYDKNVTIKLSTRLVELLHFNYSIYSGITDEYFVKVEGKSPMDIHSDTYAVYVYCDLVEHRVVGDTMAPLLRMVPTTNTAETVIHQIYEKPHYIPLAKRHFNAVEILLTADTGKELVFEGGKTILTLHFRPRQRN